MRANITNRATGNVQSHQKQRLLSEHILWAALPGLLYLSLSPLSWVLLLSRLPTVSLNTYIQDRSI